MGGPVPDDEAEAALKDGTAVDNPLRELWLNQISLSTALNTAYFAESVSLFSIVMGAAVLLSGIGFLVLTLRLLSAPARKEAEAAAKAPAASAIASG